MKNGKLPLGRDTGYPQNYAPETLFAIPRSDSRAPLGIGAPLPFHGVDIWNAWELTWLNERGRPEVGVAEIRVPADSPHLVESKSLKLYLGSFAMTRIARADLAATIARDLSDSAGATVEVLLDPVVDIAGLNGACIDTLDIECASTDVDAELLRSNENEIADEVLHSHLLRSLCPVTGQPDMASIEFAYEGPRIDRESLLRYIVSFREHQDFHEACVERMFVDIMARCQPSALAIHARYTRRGGIDINPVRSTTEARPRNTRLWRQ